ncbi:MAG: class I SAM-dependent methyltransferase, partial [Albidovulum sp.]|uniref:class I SAM-dependent methyltransferase n=1 Tax=Albidovulum sp. TaxID=1872424 RepID=UPI003CA7EA1C
MSFKNIYEDWADSYDLMYRHKDGGIEEFNRLCAKVLPPDLKRKRILEIGCGTGQAAAALALAGHQVTAIDFSPKKLEIARGRAARLGLDIDFQEVDFLEKSKGEPFDVALALSSFVTHFLEEERQMRCIRRFRDCLTPDGIAIVGIYDYGKIMRNEPDLAISHVAPIPRQGGDMLYFQRRTWTGEPRNPVHRCCYFMVPD